LLRAGSCALTHHSCTQAAKAAQEAALEALLAEHDIDLIVMARYMQASDRLLCECSWMSTPLT
jgi:formyltetrahydrofolate hydrolase